MEQTFSLLKSVFYRFVRGFLAGSVSTMATVVVVNVKTLHDLGTWLGILGLSAIVGGVTGGILAIDKFLRSNTSEE